MTDTNFSCWIRRQSIVFIYTKCCQSSVDERYIFITIINEFNKIIFYKPCRNVHVSDKFLIKSFVDEHIPLKLRLNFLRGEIHLELSKNVKFFYFIK